MTSRYFTLASIFISLSLGSLGCASSGTGSALHPDAPTTSAADHSRPDVEDNASGTPADQSAAPSGQDIDQSAATTELVLESGLAGDSETVGEPQPVAEPGIEPEIEPEPDPEQAIEPAPAPMTPAQQCAANGDFACARRIMLEDLRSGVGNISEFWAYVDADPMLTETLYETVMPSETNSISALGGGSTVSFKYVDEADESAKAAIKPDQDLRQTMYRSEIAYYRLCQIVGCSFSTPVTRPVRWSKADFNRLYAASDSKKNAAYRSKFEHLIWAREDGVQYLYAAYKEWIPDFVGFPIEVTAAWTIYERPNTTNYPDLATVFKNALAGGRERSVTTVRKLLGYAGDMTTRDFMQQLSDLTLIDYLTNNWDRYSGAQSNYGANCHFQPGGIVAIDNGAAFPPWHAPRVVKRLHSVQTFSRALVENLRLLDPDDLLARLIPNPTKEELKSYERFKERRRDALKYIDGLIDKYGVDKVLVF